MGFETGLYGQDERSVAGASAFEERCRDVEGENGARRRNIRTELHYRKVMARIVLSEMKAVRQENLLTRQYLGNDDDPMGFLGDFLRRVCDIPVARQKDCLNRLGRVAEQMQRDGFHLLRVFTALNCAVPMALTMKRDRDAKAEQGDRPRSRVGRTSTVYRIPPENPGSVLSKLMKKPR